VALHADRLAHRQRQAVLTDYFEHIMQLPLTFHTGTHSGRLMKVMLNGTDAHCRFWNNRFRDMAPAPSAANRPAGEATPTADDIAARRAAREARRRR